MSTLSTSNVRSHAHPTGPDFLIIGHSKSGTTALHEALEQHPDIYMSQPKEPNFFASDLCGKDIPGSFHQMSEEEYISLFAKAGKGQLRGESSASNIYSTEAPRNICEWNPGAKLIAIFREPVDYLHSYHLQMLKNPITDGESVKSFKKALELEPLRKQGKKIPRGQMVPSLLYYSERVSYPDQARRYLRYFPRKQLLILTYDDFKADNQAVLSRICGFLEIDSDFAFSPQDVNRGKRLRSKVAQDALYNLSHGNGRLMPLKRIIKRVVPSEARRRIVKWTYANVIFGSKKSVDSKLRTSLKRRFKPEVVELSKLLGRDLVTMWSYDDL